MILATAEEVQEYLDKARAWLCTPSGRMFNDCKSVARTAYAEALANVDGKTIYNLNQKRD
ncbi:hypothetical protein AVU32_gp104 [Vibrio phage ValKK3]|uniref:Uncharacterized protein n=1 Tax=Vibrio phage ValKK3 TaxID=1610855 RepID=A0A0D4DAM4_9CAUD|nr:hypothetical protein AVU32_gp104 [Vibrio phage ValKK3]AJT60945.1 hypothetical protein [Vibrio phage ValKK3]